MKFKKYRYILLLVMMTLCSFGSLMVLTFSAFVTPVVNAQLPDTSVPTTNNFDYRDPINSSLPPSVSTDGPSTVVPLRPADTPFDPSTETLTSGFVKCGLGKTGPTDCDLLDLMRLIDSIIQYVIGTVVVSLATIVIIYAGIKTLSEASQGKPTTVYKKMLQNVLIGMVWALGSYAIIKSILLMLVKPDGTFGEAISKVFSTGAWQ